MTDKSSDAQNDSDSYEDIGDDDIQNDEITETAEDQLDDIGDNEDQNIDTLKASDKQYDDIGNDADNQIDSPAEEPKKDHPAVRAGKAVEWSTNAATLLGGLASSLFPQPGTVPQPADRVTEDPAPIVYDGSADLQRIRAESSKFQEMNQEYIEDSIDALADMKSKSEEELLEEEKARARQEEKDRMRGRIEGKP